MASFWFKKQKNINFLSCFCLSSITIILVGKKNTFQVSKLIKIVNIVRSVTYAKYNIFTFLTLNFHVGGHSALFSHTMNC